MRTILSTLFNSNSNFSYEHVVDIIELCRYLFLLNICSYINLVSDKFINKHISLYKSNYVCNKLIYTLLKAE